MAGTKNIGVLFLVCMLLPVFSDPLPAQGVSREEYTDLDKYIDQGREMEGDLVDVKAAEFLEIPVGARGVAMGNAYSAAGNDISAIWWNPAGLGFLTQNEAMFFRVNCPLNVSYSYAAAALPLFQGKAVAGGFFGYYALPQTEITTIASPQGTGRTFKAYYYQTGGSLAYNLLTGLSAGISLKRIHQEMSFDVSGDAWAVDAGVIYRIKLEYHEIKFACTIQNQGSNLSVSGPRLVAQFHQEGGELPPGYEYYTTDISSDGRSERQVVTRTSKYQLPRSVNFSASYSVLIGKRAGLLAAFEHRIPRKLLYAFSSSSSFGAELSYNFTGRFSAAVRAGVMKQRTGDTDYSSRYGYIYLGDSPDNTDSRVGCGVSYAFAGRFVRFDYARREKRGRLQTPQNYFTLGAGF